MNSQLEDETRYPLYRASELGKCKLTGTPKQPAWLYANPRVGIFFFECEHLRGKASFGFPKAEGTKKLYEWKKTSYLNEVPRARPLISYITANGKPRKIENNPNTKGYRMRIVKIARPEETLFAERAKQLVLCDIREVHSLAKRQGPRPQRKSTSPTHETSPSSVKASNAPESLSIVSASARVKREVKREPQSLKNILQVDTNPTLSSSKPEQMRALNPMVGPTNVTNSGALLQANAALQEFLFVMSQAHAFHQVRMQEQMRQQKDCKNPNSSARVKPNLIQPSRNPIPISPLKRLSIQSEPGLVQGVTGSPKGAKMQKITSESEKF